MFRKNEKHHQPALISAASELPEKQRSRLEESWAGTFYKELFCRINEDIFACLYSEKASRPNVPVNVLLGLEMLKAGFGWSDQELYDHYCYDLQVRYALGYDRLGDGEFGIRSLYYFRERLNQYMEEKGGNLLERAFEEITDEQIKAFAINTKKQRMDSSQIASNIRNQGRLQLLVKVIQRVHRILTEEEQKKHQAEFTDYVNVTAEKYIYRLNKEEITEHIEKAGRSIQKILDKLAGQYGEQETYQMMKQVFEENFRIENEEIKRKTKEEINASSIQSPDDMDATFRHKAGKNYKGYVFNITETCEPENKFQLITKVQLAPNTAEDATFMREALPNLKERTGLEVLYTDGAYTDKYSDKDLRDHKVEQIQTSIRGTKHKREGLHLTDFEIMQNQDGEPIQIICPQGHETEVYPTAQRKGFVGKFEDEHCRQCPLVEQCPTYFVKRSGKWHIRFTQQNVNVAQRRRKQQKFKEEEHNLRAAVEATVRQVKYPYPTDKLPVRGLSRMTYMIIAAAAMVNVRRIQSMKKNKQDTTANKDEKTSQNEEGFSFAVWHFREICCLRGLLIA